MLSFVLMIMSLDGWCISYIQKMCHIVLERYYINKFNVAENIYKVYGASL